MAEKILVIDDEPEVRDAIADLLRAEGFQPETTSDSMAAAGLISTFAYDVILSDIVMPGLSGLQLLSLIKARTPSPDVILFTGFSTRERAMEALERGAFAYLEKPFDVAELLERVKQALWKRKLENGNGNRRR